VKDLYSWPENGSSTAPLAPKEKESAKQ